MATQGKCILAGAGPGDLGLVTLRAKDAIERAEVIVYDYLCNPEILKWATSDAEIVYAGKKAGRHTLTQTEINELIVQRARAGKNVVRLKGGDPFVFGRGGEEAEALAAAGIDFEVVPGVTSAIAVPAYAGIPVTHREVTSSFTVFTGHEDPTKPDSALDYESLVRGGGTLIMLMGVERLERVVAALGAHGAALSMPVALIVSRRAVRKRSLEHSKISLSGRQDLSRRLLRFLAKWSPTGKNLAGLRNGLCLAAGLWSPALGGRPGC